MPDKQRDRLLQDLGAGGEDVPELMFSVDFDAEWEKEQLLKADEGAGSPKAELSQWTRLFNTSTHRQTSHKPHAPGSPMELGSREEPLRLPTAPQPRLPPACPPGPPVRGRRRGARVAVGCAARPRCQQPAHAAHGSHGSHGSLRRCLSVRRM
ncbi:uncharacterized protein LJ206_019923 [Theristicus caerulescens]